MRRLVGAGGGSRGGQAASRRACVWGLFVCARVAGCDSIQGSGHVWRAALRGLTRRRAARGDGRWHRPSARLIYRAASRVVPRVAVVSKETAGASLTTNPGGLHHGGASKPARSGRSERGHPVRSGPPHLDPGGSGRRTIPAPLPSEGRHPVRTANKTWTVLSAWACMPIITENNIPQKVLSKKELSRKKNKCLGVKTQGSPPQWARGRNDLHSTNMT